VADDHKVASHSLSQYTRCAPNRAWGVNLVYYSTVRTCLVNINFMQARMDFRCTLGCTLVSVDEESISELN